MTIQEATTAQKDVMTLLKSGSAFQNPVSGDIVATTGSLQAALSKIDTVGNGQFDDIRPELEGAIGQMSEMQSHTNELVGKLPKRLNVMRQHSALESVFNSTSSRSLCDVLDAAFGSILGVGKAILGAIGAAVLAVTALIESLVDAVTGIVGAITEAARQALNALMDTLRGALSTLAGMIAQEVQAFIDALKNLVDYNALLSMVDWLTDPCSKQIIDQVATPEMQAASSALFDQA